MFFSRDFNFISCKFSAYLALYRVPTLLSLFLPYHCVIVNLCYTVDCSYNLLILPQILDVYNFTSLLCTHIWHQDYWSTGGAELIVVTVSEPAKLLSIKLWLFYFFKLCSSLICIRDWQFTYYLFVHDDMNKNSYFLLLVWGNSETMWKSFDLHLVFLWF